jgi:CTP:molybdopterin cytidylyltransferase MocA
VVLGRKELARLDELEGDMGANALLAGGNVIECSDIFVASDVDTPEDLEAIRHEARAVL